MYTIDYQTCLLRWYYTPVSAKLRKMAERLGDLLHVMRESFADDHPWWSETRELLRCIADELGTATSGQVVAAKILDKETGAAQFTLEHIPNADEILRRIPPNTQARLEMRFLDALPAELVESSVLREE